ncbi:ABC transporter permease [Thermoactinospora rubra]|uniref:ABC transporter permease n=1 Tax=Thermoactinospora rubra TaxID=1088767 RepID=UPI000A11F581|nr:ABC transporter permease [Thermoactinospora rubra]
MTGTFELVRLALRRDRLMLPVWIVVITGAVAGTASAIAELYPAMEQRVALGVTIGSTPALQGITGPVFDATSVGGLTAWRATNLAAVLAGLMSILLVTRHTRAEEETGRAELIGSCPVGRHAIPAAAVILAAGANLLLALLLTLALSGQGLPMAGALAFGLAVGGVGWLFAGVAVVAAQLAEHARSANGAAVSVLGLAFLLRASGDAAGIEALSWASPLGWAPRVRAFAGERWWVAGLLVLTGLVLVGLAALPARRRDVGSGLLPARRGPADAAPRLASPQALAWRLQRGGLLGWAAGFAVVGAMLGALATSVGDVVDDNPQLAAILERMGGAGALVDTFLAAEIGILGLVAGGFAVQSALRLQAEEVALRAEPVLAGAVSRREWALSHLVMALGGTAAVLTAGGLAAGSAHGARTGEMAEQVIRLLGAAWVQVPAAWVLAGIAMLLFGLLPRYTALAWAALAAFALLGQLGELLQLDDWIRSLSPFAHLPQVPAQDVSAAPLLWLTAVTVALALVGIAAFQRRDLAGN